MDKVFLPGRLKGAADAVASKSEAHRRLICAGLTNNVTTLEGFSPSGDITATLDCLKALGASWTTSGGSITVTGGGHAHECPVRLDCGESGSTLRFFVPIAMALAGGGVFIMHGHLSERPMDVYRDLFVPKGAEWYMGIGIDGAAELHVEGTLKAGRYALPGNVSSQFISGLLFALPLLTGDSELEVTGPVESESYIHMTLRALEKSGIVVKEIGGYHWMIPGGQTYHADSGLLHGDYSQAAVLLCAGALGGDVTVNGLLADSIQGDRAIVSLLQKLGANVTVTENSVRVCGGELHGADLDMHNCPDIAPIIALVCQLAEGTSTLTGCRRLRLKESDRFAATVKMLNKLGGSVEATDDAMRIKGVKQLTGGAVNTAKDHRMVMLASIAALCCREPVRITDAEALNKSWPEYLSVYGSLGGRTE